MTNGAEKLKPCPFCGTAMRDHGHCFSHPRPSGPDCIIRHYSFDKQKAEQWNTRTPAPSSDIEELVAWLNEVRTGRHGDITLHSGMAGIRLKQAADTLLAIQGERDALAKEAYEEGVEDGIAWHCFPESGPRPTWEARAALTATG
jgi:hypothetical protein